MWKRYRSVFQVHIKYIHNEIVKPYRFVILHYAECVREMNDIENYPPPAFDEVRRVRVS